MMKEYIKLARPYQYIKNLFIFAPAFFSFRFDDAGVLYDCFLAFIAFSLTASAVYVFNDINDRAEDAQHHTKKHRPVASGQISLHSAWVFLSALLIIGAALMAYVSLNALCVLAVYLIVNIAYTLKLKHIAIVDVVIIALGFVLRLFVGMVVVPNDLTHWIVVMTALLALFLALAKRRDEVLIWLNTGKKTRKNLDGYNLIFLDYSMMMSAGIVIIGYILWSITPYVIERFNNDNIYLTSIFVLVGIMRYMQLTFVYEQSADPSKLVLSDRFLQIVICSWLLSFAVILYVL